MGHNTSKSMGAVSCVVRRYVDIGRQSLPISQYLIGITVLLCEI